MKKEAVLAAREAFSIEEECLRELGARFDERAFSRAVSLLSAAPRIGASGCGHSGIACRHFAHLMCCIERPARFLSPSEAVHGAMGFLQPGDAMLLASRGGKTKELFPIAEICRAKGVKIITVTENLESPLAKGADVVIQQYVNRETDKFNSQGTTSTTALCAIFHALQAALIVETGFQERQFALIHPGGAVGERLNAKQEEEHGSDRAEDRRAQTKNPGAAQ
jgi:D-arabinose 5-phosphate isomerase GutQ